MTQIVEGYPRFAAVSSRDDDSTCHIDTVDCLFSAPEDAVTVIIPPLRIIRNRRQDSDLVTSSDQFESHVVALEVLRVEVRSDKQQPHRKCE